MAEPRVLTDRERNAAVAKAAGLVIAPGDPVPDFVRDPIEATKLLLVWRPLEVSTSVVSGMVTMWIGTRACGQALEPDLGQVIVDVILASDAESQAELRAGAR